MDWLHEVALAAGLAWASGIRLYATLLIAGAAAHFGWLELPPALTVLAHPAVMGAAGAMALGEFVADKVPAIDSAWDAVHTFIRIPIGAMLAWGAMGNATPDVQMAAALLGGTIAGGTHLAKMGTRAAINTSPEPFSNWTMSFSEDGILLGGLWLVFQHPLVFLVLLAAFLVLLIWLVPKLFRFLAGIWRRLVGGRTRAVVPTR